MRLLVLLFEHMHLSCASLYITIFTGVDMLVTNAQRCLFKEDSHQF